MATRTVDKSKLWSENSAGAQFAEGVAQRGILPPCITPRESWSGETEGGSGGRAGGGKRRTAETSQARICRWVEGLHDKHGGRTMLLWMSDVNGDFGLDRNEEGRQTTTKGQVVGGVRPKEENSNSREMRKMAQESYLAVATSWHDIGSTFFGDSGRSSRIDHVVVPQAALGLVCSCRTLSIESRRLQPFSTRERREHIPVAVELEVPLRCPPLSDPRIKIDKSELM